MKISSKTSGLGEKEFKNEVVVVAKLQQYINLVKLLRFCLERKEKVLVYELYPTKTLISSFLVSLIPILSPNISKK